MTRVSITEAALDLVEAVLDRPVTTVMPSTRGGHYKVMCGPYSSTRPDLDDAIAVVTAQLARDLRDGTLRRSA